ncbi:MAG: TetR/AcrR family transcriptional regulator [Geminicoccaceae bacterium]
MNDFTPLDRTSAKAQQILTGAREAFRELGYEGASTDEIVRRAGVSKGTLYKYFADKPTLFAAVVEVECREQAEHLFQLSAQFDDIEQTLREIARNLVQLILSPFMQGIFRLAVAESQRFPDLARAFYSAGPDLGIRRMSQLLAAAVARGELEIKDVELAAHQFEQLCKADVFFKCLFQVKASFREDEINRVADGAVDTFLRAYRPRCRA